MSTENRYNYYDILEVDPGATQHDITVAYEKAKKIYSFKNPEISKIFSENELSLYNSLLDEAYQILGDTFYRKVFESRLQNKRNPEYKLTLDSMRKYSDLVNQRRAADQGEAIAVATESAVRSLQKDESPVAQKKNEALESEMASASEWSGNFLQKVREYKGMSIERLHEVTKVNPWYLKALESMDPENLPAPVYVRGYVVQMAKSLGLNEKLVADSYMKLYKNKLGQK
jgi:curved DNA-binding protein CbpA